jgi:hypothetical protein
MLSRQRTCGTDVVVWRFAVLALSLGCGRLRFDHIDAVGDASVLPVHGESCADSGTCQPGLICLRCQGTAVCGALDATQADDLGQGTPAQPYVIGVAAQRIDLASRPAAWGSHFCVGADIDLAGIGGPHPMIGSLAVPFAGSLDGGGHFLGNFQNTAGDPYSGVFGYVDSVAPITIYDLGIIAPIVRGGEPTGGLVGHLERGTLQRVATVGAGCEVRSSGNHAGGLVGSTAGASTIEDAYSTCWVTANANGAGGLVGHFEGTLARAYSAHPLPVTGRSRVGGLCGRNQFGDVRDAFTVGAVEGDSATGNVNVDIGDVLPGTVSTLYYDLASSVSNQGTGGISGAFGTGIDTAVAPEHFFVRANPPLSQWSFPIVWVETAAGYPILWFFDRP